jgi:hypothetical protein
MGFGFRAFLIDEHDRPHRLPADMLLGESKKACPDYAGKRVRYMLAVLVVANRKPLYIYLIECGYMAFDKMGRPDEHYKKQEMRSAVNCIQAIGLEEKKDRVIDASHQFAARRYRHVYKWKPTPKLIHEIRKVIFGRGRNCGK